MSTNPSNCPRRTFYQAADWLRVRHPFLDGLVQRIAGDSHEWLDEVAGAILDAVDNGAAWVQYRHQHREPRDEGDAAYSRWEAAGPKATPRGHAYAVMSGGEARVIRLVATLANYVAEGSRQRFVPWSAHDLGGWDERGAAIFNDWVRNLTAQVV